VRKTSALEGLLLGALGLGLVACGSGVATPAAVPDLHTPDHVVETGPAGGHSGTAGQRHGAASSTTAGASAGPTAGARTTQRSTAKSTSDDSRRKPTAAGAVGSEETTGHAAARRTERATSATPVNKPPATARPGTALAILATLPVKGRAPKTGYDRARFGSAWTDDVSVQGGHNGCDTRNDVLRRDLRRVHLKPGTYGCVVLTGTLADPYTGTTIAFARGVGTSSEVQIDHVVALSNAWQTGGQQLSADRRQDLAGDPLNLWAVQGRANMQKQDGDAATWLPSNKAIRCLYVARQVAVKHRYHLWVTPPERDAIARILGRCTSEPLPTTARWATPAPDRSAAPARPLHRTPRPERTRHPAPPAPLVSIPKNPVAPVYYTNCDAARAAGAAPVHRGDPGYARHLDRDGDGVGCE
jgi:hypothetical protein